MLSGCWEGFVKIVYPWELLLRAITNVYETNSFPGKNRCGEKLKKLRMSAKQQQLQQVEPEDFLAAAVFFCFCKEP
jgi:hypothetical protein